MFINLAKNLKNAIFTRFITNISVILESIHVKNKNRIKVHILSLNSYYFLIQRTKSSDNILKSCTFFFKNCLFPICKLPINNFPYIIILWNMNAKTFPNQKSTKRVQTFTKAAQLQKNATQITFPSQLPNVIDGLSNTSDWY